MAIGFPVKANYASGDILTAAQMNDLSGTLNYMDPTAKGDLFPASSGTALTRLAVGSNGETLVADSSQTTGLRYTAGNPIPNPIINSCFDIAQRGTSVAVTAANTYTLDRWNFFRGGFVTGATVSRQATGDTTNLPFVQYCARVQRDSGNTSTQGLNFETGVETTNSIPFAGKAVTVSFYARKGADYSTTSNALTVGLYSGTGTDQKPSAYTGSVLVVGTTVTLTATWQRFTATGTVGATATEIGIFVNNTPVGTAGAADYYEITGVQVDIGSVALPIRRTGSTIQGELSAVQRYYWRSSATGAVSYAAFSPAYAKTSTQANSLIKLPVTMRVVPTGIDAANLGFQAYGGTIYAVTSPVFNAGCTTQDLVLLEGTISGATAGHTGQLISNASASGYLGFSAEL
jgi:hypothetical protein